MLPERGADVYLEDQSACNLLGYLSEQIRLTRLRFPTPEWSKNSSVERDRNKTYIRDNSLTHSSYLTKVPLIKFPLTIFFSDWCLDYESRKCEKWKDDGLCQSPIRSRVQLMIRRLCMETCNYCGKFLHSLSNSSLDILSNLVYYHLSFFSFVSFLRR